MKSANTHKTFLITCPHCGAQYLPGEIYLPGTLIGQPTEVIKDSFGKILYEDYFDGAQEPDMIEHYTCDYCNRPFVVEATVTYRAREEAPERDFTKKYVSLLDD